MSKFRRGTEGKNLLIGGSGTARHPNTYISGFNARAYCTLLFSAHFHCSPLLTYEYIIWYELMLYVCITKTPRRRITVTSSWNEISTGICKPFIETRNRFLACVLYTCTLYSTCYLSTLNSHCIAGASLSNLMIGVGSWDPKRRRSWAY